MQTTTNAIPISKARFWAGLILSTLPVLMLIMSGVMKFTGSPQVVEGFAKFGYPADIAIKLGIVELVCTALYILPQTSMLGAILLTGYLGGATATHVRVGDPFFAPIVVGVFLWLGLLLRDVRVQVLLPFRT